MYHFNVSIKDYFPWYTYTNDLTPPQINEELRKVFVKTLPSEFGPMLYIWFGDRTYNHHDWIQNRELTVEDHITYFKTGLDFMSDKQISVDIKNKIGSLYLNPNLINFTVENWLDLERQRLFYLLGIKEKSQEYLQLIEDILELNEIVDYHKTTINDLGLDINIEVSNFENLKHINIELIGVTPELVMETIREYNGSNDFYNSLKSYLHSKGHLTDRQIQAASKTIGTEIIKLHKNKICIKIEESIEYNHKDKIDEIKSLIYRLEKMGYQHKIKNNIIIIYK